MRYQRLDLNLLIALRVLLNERNVTRASELLNVSQPAVSGMLARLREYFDDALITPVGRRMELTPLARTLLDKVNDLMLRLDAALSTRPDFDPATSRRSFSIVASDYTVPMFIGALHAIRQAAPNIAIEFRQPTANAAAELDNGEVDFVINPSSFGSPGQSSAPLFEDGYHLVVDPRHLNLGDAVDLATFKALRHVTLENKGRPLFESWFIGAHGALPRADIVVHNFSLLPLMVLDTPRVSVMHTRMAVQVCRLWPLRPLRLAFAPPRLLQTLQWHHYRDADPGNQWLREQLIDHARTLPSLDELLHCASPAQ